MIAPLPEPPYSPIARRAEHSRAGSSSPAAARLAVIGVLNITPDSFSDGGRYRTVADAVTWAERLWTHGADLIDVGGESTRPGAERVPVTEEIERVVPVIAALTERGIATSIDTMRAAVARAALDAGAGVVNDVSGGLGDPAMAGVVAERGVPWILMHWRGHSTVMTQLAHYDDVVTDVVAELQTRIDDALAAGVARTQLVIDPGLGFAKNAQHNWQLLARLDRFVDLGYPVLVGASRKSFLGTLLAEVDGSTAPRPVAEREDATTALTTYAALAGAWGVRVHDVRASVDAAATVAAIQRAR